MTDELKSTSGPTLPDAEPPNLHRTTHPDYTTSGNLLQAALSYASRGWYVFPCREKPGNPYKDKKTGRMKTPKEKSPYTENGLDDATTEPAKIRAWWTRWPNAMIGIACGPSGLFVIDLDTKKGKDGPTNFERLGFAHSGALHSRTPSGGFHVVYTGTGKTSTNEAAGIDTRGEGGYIIAPPSKIIEGEFTGEYRAQDDWTHTPAPLPAGLVEVIESLRDKSRAKKTPPAPPRPVTLPQTDEVEKARQALARLAPWRCDDYQPWLEVGMSLTPLGEAGLALWDSWSQSSPKYQPGVCAEKWDTFKPGAGLTLGSLFHWAAEDDPRSEPVCTYDPPEPDFPPMEDFLPVPPVIDFIDDEIDEEDESDSFPITANVPELPKASRLSDPEIKQAEKAGAWIDDYVKFAVKASPMTPAFFHESFALGLLSTAIARRVIVRAGKHIIFPNLYMLLVAQSTLYAKTTGLDVVDDVLKMSGLNYLTLPAGVTPQSLITELSNRTPPTFSDWSKDDQDDWRKERQFSAQRAWWMDEAASLLDLFKQKHTADLLSLILKLYNGPEKLTATTIGRGRETVRYSYLTICGPTTPAAMRTHLKNQELWGDGLFARFLFVTPNTPPVRAFYSDATIETPPELAKHLNSLAFTKLPMPKETGLDSIQMPPTIQAVIPDEVFKRWDLYHAGIWQLLNRKTIPEKLYSCYGRLATTAIKIATLLAASDWAAMSEGNPLIIRPGHWARAQMMTEEYRASLHRLIEDASNPIADEDQDIAEKVIARANTKRNSRREIGQDLHMWVGTQRDRLERIFDQLLKDGRLFERETKGKRGPGTLRLYTTKNP